MSNLNREFKRARKKNLKINGTKCKHCKKKVVLDKREKTECGRLCNSRITKRVLWCPRCGNIHEERILKIDCYPVSKRYENAK